MTDSETIAFTTKNLIYAKVLGFCSFSVINGKSVTKPVDIFWLLLSLAIGTSICYVAFVGRHTLATSKSDIANKGNLIGFTAMMVASMSAMCINFKFRHRLWGLVLKMVGAEESVSKPTLTEANF
jgi:hypothetical protein